MLNPYEVLQRNAERHPERIALRLPDSRISYRDFVKLVDGLAETLHLSGFRPGYKVVVMVKPGLELYALAFALFKIKGTPVIVDPGMGLKRILASYRHVGAEAFIGLPITQIIRVLAKDTFRSIRLVYTVKKGRLTIVRGQVAVPIALPVPVDKEDLAFITFTTGSTGPAKAVEASFGMLEAAVHIIRTQFEQGDDERDLVSMPFFGLVSLLIGSTVVIPRMNPGKPGAIHAATIAKTMRDEGITSMLASPAFYDRLSRYTEREGIVFPKLRIMSSGGAPMTLDIMRRCTAMIPPEAKFFVCWGATEGLPLSSIRVREVESLIDSVISEGRGSPIGRPVNGVQLEIIRLQTGDAPAWSDRGPLPPGELGEIIATGANVSLSYYRDEKANRGHKIVDPEGRTWHRTGDIGYFDEEARLIFTGRMAHLVTIGQVTLHSVACEGVSNQHPAVKRSALVKARDRAVMIIELKAEANRSSSIPAEVLAILKKNPRTANIDEVRIHRSFPVDPRHNAKIERAKLAQWAEHEISPFTHLAKLIPLAGWAYLFAPLFVELQGIWLAIWWIDLILSTVAHAAQIPKAWPVAEIHGYSKAQSAFYTMLFGATFWKPLVLQEEGSK